MGVCEESRLRDIQRVTPILPYIRSLLPIPTPSLNVTNISSFATRFARRSMVAFLILPHTQSFYLEAAGSLVLAWLTRVYCANPRKWNDYVKVSRGRRDETRRRVSF